MFLLVLLKLQRNKFDFLGNGIKSKIVNRNNKNLDTKKEKYIVIYLFYLITQNLTKLIYTLYKL